MSQFTSSHDSARYTSSSPDTVVPAGGHAHSVHDTSDSQPRVRPGDPNRFVAVRRKKISTFFIGNIDKDVVAGDFYEFLKLKGIKLTNIRLFYNTNSLSARINIPSEFEDVVLCDDFWPDDMIIRKWKSRSEFVKERAESGLRRDPRVRAGRNNRRSENELENANQWSDSEKRWRNEWTGDDWRDHIMR